MLPYDTIEADRRRLIARDPLANLINEFLNGDLEELELVCPEPGTVLDNGVTFLESDGVNAEKMYSRVYTMALRAHWLKNDVWLRKRGASVWMYKYDPNVGKS